MYKYRRAEFHEAMNHFLQKVRDSQSSPLRNKDWFNDF